MEIQLDVGEFRHERKLAVGGWRFAISQLLTANRQLYLIGTATLI
jgi:hypothetical protein